MDRRTFLKAAGLGSVTFAYGCNPSQDKNLFSLVVAPEDMVTGKATFYASTCSECPAGCGVLAKNREGRIIKLEGNPLHSINKGKLCIRGQAALQAVYDPDRLLTPKLKVNGSFKDIGFEQAIDLLREKIQKASAKGNRRIKMLSGVIGDSLLSVFTKSLGEWKSDAPVLYEPFSLDSLKAAHQALFSQSILPSYHLDKADLILGFGADFLETWLSPVEYAQKFKKMHGVNDKKKGMFIHVGPFMSLTAANADKFISVKPGNEIILALGIIQTMLKTNNYSHLPEEFTNGLKPIVAKYNASYVENNTGIKPELQKSIANRLLKAKKPLVLGGASPTDTSLALDLAATIINILLDKELSLYAFDRRHAVEKVSTTNEVIDFFKDAATNPTDLCIFYHTNPLFTFPAHQYLDKIFKNKNTFKVSFSNFLDETSENSDLVFPIRLSLETWDTYAGTTDIVSTFQPAMGQLTKAPQIGDVFIELTEQLQDFENYQHYLMDYYYPDKQKNSVQSWLTMIQNGGKFEAPIDAGMNGFSLNSNAIESLKKSLLNLPKSDAAGLSFMAVPSIRYYDGRGANKSWLNEIPDPVTNIAWEAMAIVHPTTLKKKGLKQGDIIKLDVGEKSIQAPVYSFTGVHQDLIVMQLGLGHKNYGRFAKGNSSNPLELLSNPDSLNIGSISYLTTLTSLKKIGIVEKLPQTDGSRSQYKRKIAVSLTSDHADDSHHQENGLTMDSFPLTLPTEEGYDKKRDVYPPHEHDGYRWGMVIDLDRCIGCSACVAACYAENNVAVVGKEELTAGREMSWLRIERYEDKSDEEKLIFLPMMCQHCDNAPCEAVCPVYAPYHSKEGLNNQIYNRYIGTRFCAQNCPYKVRRFNWHDWKFDIPLNLQLNPNVTVRSKGVMEKCSFCVQRIKEVHGYAKNDNRKIRDGEVKPACVQTCPTNAMTFGNFMDKNSAVYKLAKDPRAYQVLGYLNTKSAVIYLKKIVQEV